MTLKLRIWGGGGGVALKVAQKSLKIAIYWCKMTKYSVLDYYYRILEYLLQLFVIMVLYYPNFSHVVIFIALFSAFNYFFLFPINSMSVPAIPKKLSL